MYNVLSTMGDRAKVKSQAVIYSFRNFARRLNDMGISQDQIIHIQTTTNQTKDGDFYTEIVVLYFKEMDNK
jgi:hypothetical protein